MSPGVECRLSRPLAGWGCYGADALPAVPARSWSRTGCWLWAWFAWREAREAQSAGVGNDAQGWGFRFPYRKWMSSSALPEIRAAFLFNLAEMADTAATRDGVTHRQEVRYPMG